MNWFRSPLLQIENPILDERRCVILALFLEKAPEWAEGILLSFARTSFQEIRCAKSRHELHRVEKKIHSSLYQAWKKKIDQERERSERTELKDLIIRGAVLTDVYSDPQGDHFSVRIEASGFDRTVCEGRAVWKSGKQNFHEVWTFSSTSDGWILSKVEKLEAETGSRTRTLKAA